MLENLKSKFFVKKQYYIWIISYAIIIFLVLLISLIEHTISIRVVEEEIVQNANRNIAQIENVYDGYFSNIESIGYNLLYSSSVERFIKRPLPQNDSEKTEWIRNVMRDLNTNIASKELISKALLVFRDIDMCIDTSGMYKQKDAFDIMFSGFYANKDAWLSDILATGVKGYKVLTNINGEKKIFFVHPYIDNVYNGKAIMIFEINSDLISKKLASIAGNKNGTIYILNQKNELLFSSVQKPDISFETKEGNGNYIGNINRVKHVFNYVTSARNNWKYIYTIPSSVYSEKIDRIRYTFMVIYLACLFVSIMLAVFFSKKSYKPVKTLMNKLQNGKAHVNGENEFSYIEHKLNDLLLSKSKSFNLCSI